MQTPSDLKSKNLRLALILASVVFTFFVGFMVKVTLLSHH